MHTKMELVDQSLRKTFKIQRNDTNCVKGSKQSSLLAQNGKFDRADGANINGETPKCNGITSLNVNNVNVTSDWQTADILTMPFTSPTKWEHAPRLMSIGKSWITDDKNKPFSSLIYPLKMVDLSIGMGQFTRG